MVAQCLHGEFPVPHRWLWECMRWAQIHGPPNPCGFLSKSTGLSQCLLSASPWDPPVPRDQCSHLSLFKTLLHLLSWLQLLGVFLPPPLPPQSRASPSISAAAMPLTQEEALPLCLSCSFSLEFIPHLGYKCEACSASHRPVQVSA